jgi:7,8-dihydropterin-6-yl-methyl-4-(beta-D-ribofuranosyl)aminobenzene 5'-phosphate synthase
MIRAADRLDVLVLVDNATDSLSTTPRNVVAEWPALVAAGRLPLLSGEAICRAHHGLSLLLTAHAGAQRHTVLLDAGPEGATLVRNAGILGVDFGEVEAVVLSHGHWDHGGGLPAAVEAVTARRGAGVPCFVHPGMFVQRGNRRADGLLIAQAPLPGPDRLAAAGADVRNTREPQTLGDGLFHLSGEIPRVTPYETGLPGHVRRAIGGGDWEPDPLIMDERFLAVHVAGRGLLVFSACSHAGIVNVLTHARATFSSVPLHGAMGGLHLSGSTEPIIPETVADLKALDLGFLAPGHCTGWRAMARLAHDLGDILVPSAVGKRYLIGR